jgi:hypothetical protein
MNTRWIVLTFCGVLVGCDAASNAEWAKTVPGIYKGSQSGFVERVDLRPDGSFRHEVSVNGRSLVAESGRWALDVERGAVNVAPFTSVWDDASRKLTTHVIYWNVGVLWVKRHGHAAERISSAVGFEYQLSRTTTNSPP